MISSPSWALLLLYSPPGALGPHRSALNSPLVTRVSLSLSPQEASVAGTKFGAPLPTHSRRIPGCHPLSSQDISWLHPLARCLPGPGSFDPILTFLTLMPPSLPLRAPLLMLHLSAQVSSLPLPCSDSHPRVHDPPRRPISNIFGYSFFLEFFLGFVVCSSVLLPLRML